MKFIGELDRRLSRPLHLELKRPQLRSHPYLQGLNLLLRASGLSRVEGTGAKARLVLDPAMRMQWDQLNPTEQYFNLLEAWLRFGRAEMVGETGLDPGGTCSGPACKPGSSSRRKAAGSTPRSRRKSTSPGSAGILPAGPDGPVRARGGRAAAPAGHAPGARPASSTSRSAMPSSPCSRLPDSDLSWGRLLPSRGRGEDEEGRGRDEEEGGRRVRRECPVSGPGSRCSSRISRSGGRTWSSRSRSPRGHVHLPGVPGQGLAAHRHAGRRDTLDDLVGLVLRSVNSTTTICTSSSTATAWGPRPGLHPRWTKVPGPTRSRSGRCRSSRGRRWNCTTTSATTGASPSSWNGSSRPTPRSKGKAPPHPGEPRQGAGAVSGLGWLQLARGLIQPLDPFQGLTHMARGAPLSARSAISRGLVEPGAAARGVAGAGVDVGGQDQEADLVGGLAVARAPA